jgi:hypothetical protein
MGFPAKRASEFVLVYSVVSLFQAEQRRTVAIGKRVDGTTNGDAAARFLDENQAGFKFNGNDPLANYLDVPVKSATFWHNT